MKVTYAELKHAFKNPKIPPRQIKMMIDEFGCLNISPDQMQELTLVKSCDFGNKEIADAWERNMMLLLKARIEASQTALANDSHRAALQQSVSSQLMDPSPAAKLIALAAAESRALAHLSSLMQAETTSNLQSAAKKAVEPQLPTDSVDTIISGVNKTLAKAGYTGIANAAFSYFSNQPATVSATTDTQDPADDVFMSRFR